jgi:hypothetical protein
MLVIILYEFWLEIFYLFFSESGDADCPAPDGPALIFNVAETLTANSTKYCKAVYKENYLYLAKTHACTSTVFNSTTPGACDVIL